jgi:PAS domain S-box-containing protein
MPPSNNEDLAPILSRVSPTQLRRVLARTNLLLWWADVRREGGAYKWKFEVSTASRDNSLTLLATALATGSGLWTIESAPDINEMRARSRAALANGEPGYEQQFRIVSGGRTHWLSESAAIEAVGENQWSVFGSVTDITPRYEAELARRESEVQFEKILDSVDCVLWQARVTLDSSGAPEWYFLLIPPTRLYRRIFGTNPSDSKHSLWTEEEVPDLGDLDRRSTEALLSGAAGYSQEFKIKRDGKLLWVREQVSIAAVGPGQWKVVGIITDVTVRREAEEARRESEAQLEEILEKADCILWRARVTIKADGSGTGWLFYKVPRSRLYRRMFNRDPYENRPRCRTPLKCTG